MLLESSVTTFLFFSAQGRAEVGGYYSCSGPLWCTLLIINNTHEYISMVYLPKE